MQKIVIPGGSGFLGRTLAKWLLAKGCEVVILSRSPQVIEGVRLVTWDGRTLGPWCDELEGATAVVNLAGRTVNCRYHERNRKEMIDSRVDSTLVIGQAIAAAKEPPSVWLNSSTATVYRHRYDAANCEVGGLYGAEREAKDAYSLEVAHAWEGAFEAAYHGNDLTGTRGIVLRTAMVFGAESGGVYETLRRLVRWGLGGTMGHGRQYVSWIHSDDFCRIVDWLVANPAAEGIYNVTAPEPLPNREMMAVLRKANGVRVGLPAARWMLEVGAFFLRTEIELVVKSRRVVPQRLLEEGYQFRYSTLAKAVASLQEEASKSSGQGAVKS